MKLHVHIVRGNRIETSTVANATGNDIDSAKRAASVCPETIRFWIHQGDANVLYLSIEGENGGIR